MQRATTVCPSGTPSTVVVLSDPPTRGRHGTLGACLHPTIRRRPTGEAGDGRVFTGASIGGYLSICAELGALSQLVAATTPTIRRVVAVWRDPADGELHVIPPCGRCREFMRSLSRSNLEATAILGPDHSTTLAALLPYAGWHAEPVPHRGATP